MNWTSADTDKVDNYINSIVYNGLGLSEGIDLRAEVIGLLYGTLGKMPKGHWVVFRRYDRTKPSQFYNSDTKEGVGGTPFAYTEELLRTRHNDTGSKKDTLGFLKSGEYDPKLRIYYFDWRVKPLLGDVIFELLLDDHTNTPDINNLVKYEIFKVKKVHPYRIDFGNIAYYACECDRDMVNYV